MPEEVTPGVVLPVGLPTNTPLYLTAPQPVWGVDVTIVHIGVDGASAGVVIRRVLVANNAFDSSAQPTPVPDAGYWLGRPASTRSGFFREAPANLTLPDCCEPADAFVVEFELSDSGRHSFSALDVDYYAGLVHYHTLYPLALDEDWLRAVGGSGLTPT
jgi:hypothetical protein